METNIKIPENFKKIVASHFTDHYNGEGVKYFDEALAEYVKKYGTAREMVEYSKDIDEKDLISDIDSSITFLANLKKEGYTSIKRYGYLPNFIAVKKAPETDKDYYKRVTRGVESYVKKFIKRDRDEKQQRIKALEAELEQLKGKK